jgi:hypothetical protein
MTNSVQRALRDAERPLDEYARPHGKPSSWVFIAVIITAFMTGGIAIIVQSWVLFWLSAGVVLVGMPAGWIVRLADDPGVKI